MKIAFITICIINNPRAAILFCLKIPTDKLSIIIKTIKTNISQGNVIKASPKPDSETPPKEATGAAMLKAANIIPVSYTHLTLPTTPYV